MREANPPRNSCRERALGYAESVKIKEIMASSRSFLIMAVLISNLLKHRGVRGHGRDRPRDLEDDNLMIS